MKILAIDPGYERVGIAVLEKTSVGPGGEKLIYSDCLKTSSKLLFTERLFTNHKAGYYNKNYTNY